ncbi:CoA-substrate-specific enzyme activase [Desulfovibrio sp. X2]|uniref:acyl-CoA dehydratase activase n=1 Tax=Desulfovibrio sp. X2 TaxID=941449 RepID=UPI000358BD9B|nr:acyl-CoA dehydratase activase [Desulfovibrio sp. X2]EPR44664.1 CoA-substrate-specific enzyme activase [Desulfovibrio sp. X2]
MAKTTHARVREARGPRVLGLDIGSRSMELVALADGAEVSRARLPTTFDPAAQCRRLLADELAAHEAGAGPALLMATGYGRELAGRLDLPWPVRQVTEITAHARGARFLVPEARAVLDIGGQDTKAIVLSEAGRAERFEMNDRCAAGTGKFLEYTAQAFQIPVEEFGAYALKGSNPTPIGSMCTVFAETEATSLMAQGKRPEDIALGLHLAIARRSAALLRRVSAATPVAFVGGVARNPCARALLAAELGTEQGAGLLVPDEPDFCGALGAALLAAEAVVKAAAE